LRVVIPHHGVSLELGDEWVADPFSPETATHGAYLRSVEHGLYLNVRAQTIAPHPLTLDGLRAFLGEQSWASPPFDVWSSTDPLAVGGSFETVGMNGEVVLEVYATDGRSVANLATPADRTVIAAATPNVRKLVRTLRFA
jgi:hypothetical protein